jgi:ferredoxin
MNTLIDKSDVPKFFDKILAKLEVIAPVSHKGVIRFLPIASYSDIDFSRQSDYSAKKYFLPSPEALLSYNKDKPEVNINFKQRVLVLRPCDANAILNLDKTFLNDFPDPYYQKRRENTLLIVFKCTSPYENCFCKSVNADDTTNYDLLFTDIGDKYVVSVGTPRVREFVDSKLFSNIIRDGRMEICCQKKLEGVDKLGLNFDSKAWLSESEKCLSCNACIISCPTCYCFTVRDMPSLNTSQGKRQRQWDYCYALDHTKVAGNYIYRSDRYKRFRHRIYHQLKYFRERHGKQLCVGCGRCINMCPTKIDMVQIVNAL